MIPELKNPEDWHIIQSMLKKITPSLYIHDFSIFCNTAESKVRELCIIDIEIKKKKTKALEEKRLIKINEINTLIRTFSKMLLLASLSKR